MRLLGDYLFLGCHRMNYFTHLGVRVYYFSGFYIVLIFHNSLLGLTVKRGKVLTQGNGKKSTVYAIDFFVEIWASPAEFKV